ncbi:uncharacterized protein TM35_000681040, partial [Trypanosoma theileri]
AAAGAAVGPDPPCTPGSSEPPCPAGSGHPPGPILPTKGPVVAPAGQKDERDDGVDGPDPESEVLSAEGNGNSLGNLHETTQHAGQRGKEPTEPPVAPHTTTNRDVSLREQDPNHSDSQNPGE